MATCMRQVFRISVVRNARISSQINYSESSSSSSKLNCQNGRCLTNRSSLCKPVQISGIRHCSNDASTLTFTKPGTEVLTWTSSSGPYIPDAPTVPVEPELFNALNEPTLASQGLGGWTPVGIVENCLDFLHVTIGMPWWLSIAAGTLVIRFTLFPIFVVAQRNAARMCNAMPQMQLLQMKMSEARNSGNSFLAAKYAHELVQMMNEKGISPFKNMIAPLCQAPVFISFFFALREMANLPMESFKNGGTLWFVDLCMPDAYYLLPLITSATLFLTLELGADGGMEAKNYQLMRYVLRAIPIVVFPFTLNFPAAVLCYWVTNNFISLGMVGMMKVPEVSRFFKIPIRIKHNPDNLPMKKKKFTESVKEAMTNAKIARELSDRQRVDEIRFRKAGMGPIPKTYSYDPTKQNAALVKGRDK